MATAPTQEFARTHSEDRSLLEIVAGGSIAEAFVGLAAIVVSIVGLANIEPAYMIAIATICVGAALAFEGGGLAAHNAHMMAEANPTHPFEVHAFSIGMSAQFLGGVAGIVLGILALVGLAPAVLCAVAVLVFGGSLLLGSFATHQVNTMATSSMASGIGRELAREAVNCAAVAQFMTGIAGIVLGIVALGGTQTGLLTLIALLVLSCAVAVTGSAVSARVGQLFGSRFLSRRSM